MPAADDSPTTSTNAHGSASFLAVAAALRCWRIGRRLPHPVRAGRS
ncbi:hypothetical protein [Streptomyces tauricus]